MSSFTKHSNIKPHLDKWINVEEFTFYHDDSLTWIKDIIPAWFEFDGCSIPLCIFWKKVEPNTITACCYHDWLFREQKYWFFKSNYLFLIALRITGASAFKRAKYWFGVTLFWWITRFKKKYFKKD